jgi:hypothetical protein
MKILPAAMFLTAATVSGAGCAGSDRAAREGAERDYKSSAARGS